MPLKSASLRGDSKLESAATTPNAHILKPAAGDHVSKIQRAVLQLDDATIDRQELSTATYGDSTADAVLAYKTKREVINKTYQQDADNITGVMTMASLDKELLGKEAAAPDFIFLSDSQRSTVSADLGRSRQMLDVVVKRLRIIARTTPGGGLLITPRNLNYYDSKLKVLNVFRINTFEASDFPVPPDVLLTLRQRFRGLTLPAPSNSPTDGINFVSLLANFVRLRASLDEIFRKEFYTQGQFRGQPLGFFAAFVDARNTQDTTVRFTRFYFDPTVVPTQDDRAVTLAHERAHTVLRLNGHPGTGDNPFNVTPHLGDPNVKTADQALANPYCYEWLTDALQPNYDPARFRGQ